MLQSVDKTPSTTPRRSKGTHAGDERSCFHIQKVRDDSSNEVTGDTLRQLPGKNTKEYIPHTIHVCYIYLHLISMVNVGKYNIHGWYGYCIPFSTVTTPFKVKQHPIFEMTQLMKVCFPSLLSYLHVDD